MNQVCVLRLTADHLYFILTDLTAGGGPAVWCALKQEVTSVLVPIFIIVLVLVLIGSPQAYFNEYNIEGVSAEQNEIHLELQPEKLAKNLASLRGGHTRSVKVRQETK